MKKLISLMVVLVLASPSFAFAMSPDDQKKAHYEEMKAIKAAQREAKPKQVAAAASAGPSFWQKEGERSGFSQTGAKIGGFFGNVSTPGNFFKNQQDAYNQRKAAAGKA